jgi:hypothetical protein
MRKKITINGVHIDSILAMQNEILNKLKIYKPNLASFALELKNYIEKNEIEKLNITWAFFSISLLKMSSNIYRHKEEKFDLGHESSMHFHSFNDTLISEEDSNERSAKEITIIKSILSCFEEIENVRISFED